MIEVNKLKIPSRLDFFSRFAQQHKRCPYKRIIRVSSNNIDYFVGDNEIICGTFHNISHIHFHGLTFGIFDTLSVGSPNDDNLWRRGPGDYLGWIRFIKKQFPHLKWIWVVPSRLSNHWDRTVESLNYLYTEFAEIIDGFEFNLAFGGKDTNKMFEEINALRAPYCFNLPHKIFFHYFNVDIGMFEQELLKAEYLILESFGYTRPWIQSGQPDSAIKDWQFDYDYYSSFIPSHKILIGVDTCGIEKRGRTLTPIALVDDEHLKSHVLIRNTQNGFSVYKNDNSYISQDDEEIRKMKTNLVPTLKLGGMIIGDLFDDLRSIDTPSLFENLASLNQYQLLR